MTEVGYVAGYLVKTIVTLAFLVGAAFAIRYGWNLAGRRRDRNEVDR